MCRNFPLDSFTRMQVWRQLLDGHTDAMVFRKKWPQKKQSRVTSGSVHFFYLLIIVIISTIIVVIVFFFFAFMGGRSSIMFKKATVSRKRRQVICHVALTLRYCIRIKLWARGREYNSYNSGFHMSPSRDHVFLPTTWDHFFRGHFFRDHFFPRPDAMGITPGWV